MPYYNITLTKSEGFTEKELETFRNAFGLQSHAYVVNEFGESGTFSHLQGLVEYDCIKTSNVTLRMRRLYESANIPVSPHSIRVKKATDYIGALIYASKELHIVNGNAKLLVIRGWVSSWIDEQIKQNVSKIPYKLLEKKLTRVYQKTGGALMHAWCLANNRIITSRYDYLNIVKEMASQKYAFGTVRHKGIYSDVLSAFSDGSGAFQCAESDLLFLRI